MKYIYTEDFNIKKYINYNIDLSLVLTLERFKRNKGKDLWDYKQLMYIYIDLWKYDKAIKIWNIALSIVTNFNVNDIWIHAILSKLIQAYIFNWNLDKAEILITKYNYIDLLYERFLLEYLKWNFKYIINNSINIEDDKRHNIWSEYYILAKAYIKMNKNLEAIEVFKKMYFYWKKIWVEVPLLETYYCYIASLNLKKMYNDVFNKKKFNREFLKYRDMIENEVQVEGTTFFYNKKLMYFNINRIANM